MPAQEAVAILKNFPNLALRTGNNIEVFKCVLPLLVMNVANKKPVVGAQVQQVIFSDSCVKCTQRSVNIRE